MKTLPAKITISRPSFSDGRELIIISLTDEKSRCLAVEVEIGYADFTKAVTGLGHVSCQMTFNNSGIIGKKREHKYVIVKIPPLFASGEKDTKAIRAALEVHEKDGWRAREGDATNPHNWVGKPNKDHTHNVNVLFERYTDEQEENKI